MTETLSPLQVACPFLSFLSLLISMPTFQTPHTQWPEPDMDRMFRSLSPPHEVNVSTTPLWFCKFSQPLESKSCLSLCFLGKRCPGIDGYSRFGNSLTGLGLSQASSEVNS
ncbi:unnamed protein product [Rangifer tarandus platyrhynchus]|uniref:Secreted protein n=2 Tax=Rangifer tarandus platyrhynchus TaxID=3082113 RepID=A0ABN8Y1P1_RANTA|nr:unnamed protein product [Rangifer tarandus platyrhynchus]